MDVVIILDQTSVGVYQLSANFLMIPNHFLILDNLDIRI